MDFLDGCGFITVDQQNKTSVESALRSVRQFWLKQAFEVLHANTIRGCIRKANKHLGELLEHILQQEEADNNMENEDAENDTESNSEDD